MWKYREVTLDEFIWLVYEEFWITLSYENIKHYAGEILRSHKKWLTSIYYDALFDKLYSNKEDFYNEVYDSN